MPETSLSEELKNLTPEERIKRLKQLEELRRKELAETKKKVEDELAEAEELIKDTEEELSEEKTLEEQKQKKKEQTRTQEEESLEEKIGKKRQEQQEQPARQYETTNLYNTLDHAKTELERLYNTNNPWNDQDRQTYQRSKEEIERAQTYSLSSERLAEDLGLASGMLNKMRYKR